MNNLIVGIKKFFTNKNTVTVVGVLLAVVVLYVGYNWRIKSTLQTRTVPYAKETIPAGAQITADMIGTMEVVPALLNGNVILDAASVVDKYANIDSVIPKGSLFYGRSVVEKEQLGANSILEYPEGYVLYNFSINTELSYGNMMYPGNYIDIYLKATNKLDEANTNQPDKIMVGKLLENVKILAVLDSNGDPVFANVEEKRTPALMIFAVPEEYHILLRKASFLRAYDTSLIPVPTAESLKEEPGEVNLSSNDLKDFINRVTVWTEDNTAQ